MLTEQLAIPAVRPRGQGPQLSWWPPRRGSHTGPKVQAAATLWLPGTCAGSGVLCVGTLGGAAHRCVAHACLAVCPQVGHTSPLGTTWAKGTPHPLRGCPEQRIGTWGLYSEGLRKQTSWDPGSGPGHLGLGPRSLTPHSPTPTPDSRSGCRPCFLSSEVRSADTARWAHAPCCHKSPDSHQDWPPLIPEPCWTRSGAKICPPNPTQVWALALFRAVGQGWLQHKVLLWSRAASTPRSPPATSHTGCWAFRRFQEDASGTSPRTQSPVTRAPRQLGLR